MMAAPWVRDVAVESTPLTTTGGHTWAAAYRLADFLEAAAGELALHAPGLALLELGAGCGWLGATLARNLPAAGLVCLTEQESGGGCDWLAHNVARNAARGLPLAAVRVAPCDWTAYGAGSGAGAPAPPTTAPAADDADTSATLSAPASPAGDAPPGPAAPGPVPLHSTPLDLGAIEWDVIIGSDLIYSSIGSTCLPAVLAALAGASTRVFYCHTKHRYDLLDWEFFEALEASGLACEEVVEPGAALPPPSPPASFPPASLFPEQRIAVYSISKRPRQAAAP